MTECLLGLQISLELRWTLAVSVSQVQLLSSSKIAAPSSWLLPKCHLERETFKNISQLSCGEKCFSPREVFGSLGWREWQEPSCKVKPPLLISEAAPSLHGASCFRMLLMLPAPCLPATARHPGRGLCPPPREKGMFSVCMRHPFVRG